MGMTPLSCEVDARAGSKYRLVFDHVPEPVAFFGTYVEVKPYSRLAWTNEEGGEGGPVTMVTFEDEGGHRYCGGAPVGMTKLLVRPALSDLHKAQALEARHHFARLEDGQRSHSGDAHRLGPDELGLKVRLAVFEQHRDDLGEIALKFVQACALTMRAAEPGNVADQEAGLGITLDHCCVRPHTLPRDQRCTKVDMASPRGWIVAAWDLAPSSLTLMV